MKKLLLTLVGLVALGGIVYVVIPKGIDEAQNLDQAKAGEAKHVARFEPAPDGIVYDLDAENTKISFACAKDLAGKIVTVRGGWSGRFGSNLTGKVLTDKENQQVQQIEADIDVNSLWSEHDQLTDALLTKGFFHVDEHPSANFISTDIREGAPDDSALEGATHVIEGNFTLNGITKSISFPAVITPTEGGLKLKSQFSLNRKDFNVNFTDSAGFGLLTDLNISELVSLKLDINAEAADKNGGSELAATNGQSDSSTTQVAIDISKLSKTYVEKIPATQIEFPMVLVAGDDEKKIAPFYFGKHEVTWDEFMPWVDGRDVKDKEELGELRALKLRPSPPYGSVDRNFGMDQRPALGMSRLSAELYCEWLSEQTGKKYRLPTEQEWEHAFRLGGGNLDAPPSEEVAKRIAIYYDNAWDDIIGDGATKPVGSMEANTLGIHDMAGNVCEWVTNTADERVARGGHFDGQLAELGVGRHVENMDEWNRDYPNEPKSIWWFVNARWVGFRVVCEITGDEIATE
jgi:polyisoprenoid-binding protein YceI